MKRCAVFAAKSDFRGKFRNRTQTKHFSTLAFALLLCGTFYSLSLSDAQKFPSAQAKNENAPKNKDVVCEKPLPKASLTNPLVELYKIEVLCDKPEDKEIIPEEKPEDPEITKRKDSLREILEGTPMEQMIDSIGKEDKTVGAFLVGIAFKESKFGVYSPKKNGVDCYNYWGFKGKINPTSGGYSCFESPEQAVEKVGERLERLVIQNNLNTPSKMTVWKCGSSCATHTPESVSKWISDVSIHFYPLVKS